MSRKWRQEHREHCRLYLRRWRQEHPDKVKTYYQKQKEYGRRYQERKMSAEGHHTTFEWNFLREIVYGNVCPSCGRKVKLQRDHVVPLSEGGSDWIDNVQGLCNICNARKGTKTIKYAPIVVCPQKKLSHHGSALQLRLKLS